MRSKTIVLTGGGTGGHFFPLVAVADALRELTKGMNVEIVYVGPPSPLNVEFIKREIKVYRIAGSKWRRYFDWRNFLDIPKFLFSIFQALFLFFWLKPAVVFSKGGVSSFSVVLAAKTYLRPVIIHESDAVPGLQNKLSAFLADRIGISFREAAKFFPVQKTALVGNPVRPEILSGLTLDKRQAKMGLGFEPDQPLLAILGGSQGAAVLNNFVAGNLEALLNIVQVFHQSGPDKEAAIALSESEKKRYRQEDFLDSSRLRQVLAAADVILSRAGSGAIFEIAAFGKPSILIPLSGSAADHQLLNAYEYAQTGAAVVIEEPNFKINIVLAQLKGILNDPRKSEEMSQAAQAFARPQAAQIIAQEILKIMA